MWFLSLLAFPWMLFGWCFLVDEETSCCGSAGEGCCLEWLMLDLFGLVEAGWLVSSSVQELACSLCVIVLFLSVGWPFMWEQRKRRFCCLHCKKGSHNFCFIVAEIRNKMVVFLYRLLSSHMNSVTGFLSTYRWWTNWRRQKILNPVH